MADIGILVAPSRKALHALAELSGLEIIDERQFETLTTYKTDEYADAGVIETADAGWVGLARVP
jgi:hypothetical protein